MVRPDPIALVAAAYDRIAEEYLHRFGASPVKDRWADELIRRLAPGGHVLDLGCGAGLPLARRLLTEGLKLTGVDGSRRQSNSRVNTFPRPSSSMPT